MKKERVIASKKAKTITKPKAVIYFGEDLPIFSGVSNVNLENRNISVTAIIKDLLAPLIQQIREIRDFLNLHTKCMDKDIICDKGLVVLVLKVRLEADKENTFLRGGVNPLMSGGSKKVTHI